MNLAFGTEQITLLPEKVIVWNKTIILSDFHLGKTSHFRKQGIPLPASVIHKELSNLYTLIITYQPERILFLGDLFHSDHNQEWEFFGELRNKFDEIRFELITGNHDILALDCYQRYNIVVHQEFLREKNFLFTHEPWEEDLSENVINFCGHIHPGFRISEKKTQFIKLPCFFFYKNRLILPAYGHTTGLQLLSRKPDTRIFLVVKDSILEY
jgi:uncharacterized protein